MDFIEQILSNEVFISFVGKMIDERIEAKNCKNFIVSNKNSFIVPENDIESSPQNENLSTQVDEKASKIQKMEKFKQKSKSQSQGNEIKNYMLPSKDENREQIEEQEYQDNKILQNICKKKYMKELNIEKYQNFMTQQNNYSQNIKFVDQLELSSNLDQNSKELSQSFQNNFELNDNYKVQISPYDYISQSVQNQHTQNNSNKAPQNFDILKVAKHNNRTLSEPQLQLRKQKIISQISDVLIGISQTKMEDSFCAAINEIQNHISSIQKRISVLEITFVNGSYKDQVNEQNKLLIDNSSINYEESSKQYQMQQKSEQDNQTNEKIAQILLQINEIKENMEEKIINVWKSMGFINIKIEDLEVSIQSIEDIIKNKNQKQGIFSGKLFGF